MSGGRARRTRFAWAIGVALASLTLFFVLVVVGLEPDVSTTLSADSYSVSGLGHSGLLVLLEENGVPVLASRWDWPRARPGTSLVIAEPNPDLGRASGRRSLEDMVEDAQRVLLVAPKRVPGPPASERPRWMRSQSPMELEEVNRVFEEWDLVVHRPRGQVESPRWESAERWPTPTLVEPVQLFQRYEALIPLVSTDEGVLLGRLEMPRRDHVVLVLADPDVLANHGLVRGENAAFCLALIEELRDGKGSVVWDETWHGHVVPSNIGRLLLRPPLGYVTASLALVALLALWAGAVRFGGAVPPAPALAPGKAFLVENTADLLRAGGHSGHVLRRYLEAAERETADRLHAGRSRPGAAREAVEALARARGLAAPGELHEDVERAARAGATDARAIVAAGERIHRWKEELTHGRRRGS